MKKLLMLTMALFIIDSAPALAGQGSGKGPGKGPRSFESLDSNGDKALSKEEVANAPRLNSDFDKVDADKNGAISQEELQAFRAERRAERMNK